MTAASRTSAVPAATEPYSSTARTFHWLTAALVATQVPLGVYMVYRGEATKFDATTGTLYDTHKLLGVTIFAIVLLRLLYRLARGAPGHEPTIEPWQRVVSRINHWLLYLFLLLVPIGGYLGVSYYGAAAPFGIQLPVFVEKNEDLAKAVFNLHRLGALILLALVTLHVTAALYHHFIRKDNVLRRMAGTPR
jgi:cytochrome b561